MLCAFTPRDQKAVKIAAQTFRPNPALNTEQVITELGVGEALVSFLDEAGRPSMVDRAIILPPHSQIGPLTDEERDVLVKKSTIYGKYDHYFDRFSAYEMLQQQQQQQQQIQQQQQQHQQQQHSTPKPQTTTRSKPATTRTTTARKQSGSAGATIAKTVVSTLGSSQGQRLIRGLLGSLIRK